MAGSRSSISKANGEAAVVAGPQLPDSTSTLGDLNRFRIDQNFSQHVQARKKAVVVPVEKPRRQQWIYVHPDSAWRWSVALLEDNDNRQTYIVEPELIPDVTEDLVHKLLVAYMTRTGNPCLWPLRLAREDGYIDPISLSALTIATEHAGKWIRVLYSQADRLYSVLDGPPVEQPAPKWPEGGYEWMFETAFKGRHIKSLDHPYLRTLRGEILI